MKALFYTREFPPYVYGGAGVHVEYLAGELAKLMEMDVRCFGDQDDTSDNVTVKGFPFDDGVFENADDKLKSVPLRGYRMLKDFVYTGKNEWSEGTIYDPESGSTYSCVINKDGEVLNIRGYVGVKALGRTDVWKRIKLKK